MSVSNYKLRFLFLFKAVEQKITHKDILEALASELIEASQNAGAAFKAKTALYVQIEESRSFLRFLRK